MTKKVSPVHYVPEPEQRLELKRYAASMRGRIRAMRNLRDTVSGFARLSAGGDQPPAQAVADVAEEFRSLGWSDSAAAELAALHVTMEKA